MRLLSVLLATILILLHSLPSSHAQSLDECKVSDSVYSQFSLGFPIRKERLVYKEAPKLLVIPYYPKGENYSLSKIDKQIFEQSKQDIQRLSSKMPELIGLPSYEDYLFFEGTGVKFVQEYQHIEYG